MRPAGDASFGPATLLDGDGAYFGVPAAGIDASGRATVIWRRHTAHDGASAIRAASTGANGSFGVPQQLGADGGSVVGLAVTPEGRALAAADGDRGIEAFERAAGATRFTRIPMPAAGDLIPGFFGPHGLTVALRLDGGAAIVAGSGGDGVTVLLRGPGGRFGRPTVAQPQPTGAQFVSFYATTSGPGANLPYDQDTGAPSVALGMDGRVLVSWVKPGDARSASSVRIVHGTLSGGLSRTQRLGSPCRETNATQLLTLADGRLGVAWTDDARAISLDGQGFAQGDGRLHIALEGRGAQPASPTLPRLSARIVRPLPRRAGEPLRLRVRCRHAACDVRATAEAWGKVPTPPFQTATGRTQWDPLALAATGTIPAGHAALLEIPTIADYRLTGGPRSARHLLRLLACTMSGHIAQHLTLHLR